MAAPLKRTHNFSPGPAMLPTKVVERAQAEFANYKGSGMAVFEITNLDKDGASHPGEPRHLLQEMMLNAEKKLRKLLAVPDDYRVLFMHGGAVAQFSAVPLNLMTENKKADFIDAGFWSKRAITEAKKYVDVSIACEFDDRVKPVSEWKIRPDADYVHICLNETVKGLEVLEDPAEWPETNPPLVADATSTILSRPIDIKKYGCVYASGGKNVPANMCIVIIKNSLLTDRQAHPWCPQTMDYRMNGGGLQPTSSVFQSNPNTPPTWACFLLDLMLDHMLETFENLDNVAKWVRERIGKIYAVADASNGFYKNLVHPPNRSCMNAVFRMADKEIERKFVDEAEAEGLLFLFGHPVEGGIRVTSYIGLSDEALVAVEKFMKDFQAKNQK